MCDETCTASTSTDCDNAPPPKKTKLGTCEVCAKENAKYCCPRCELKTCSLRCSKIHKFELKCSGRRDRTKFIPVKKFSNFDLSSDYRLLEEASRVVEASKKGRCNLRYGLSKRFIVLQQQALDRGTFLKFLPKTFERHKNNSSRFNFSKKIVEWHIDWIFVNCENLKISEECVPENARISSVLSKYLSKQRSEELQEKLQYYQAADLPGIKILLEAEQKSGKKFYEVDPSSTLKECLKNRIIIEYPSIHLLLSSQASFYNIIDSDNEEESKRESKNLLFVDAFSDEEEELLEKKI